MEVNAAKILIEGTQFYKAYHRLSEQKNLGEQIEVFPIPAIVNLLFACELFFKALIMYEQNELKKGHDLSVLWNHIPNDLKKELINKLEAYAQFSQKDEFDNFLKAIKTSHVGYRYLYEKKGWVVLIDKIPLFAASLYTLACAKIHIDNVTRFIAYEGKIYPVEV